MRFSYYIIFSNQSMQQQQEPMSAKKLFGFTGVVMGVVVTMGLVFFTNFLSRRLFFYFLGRMKISF